MIDLEKKYFGFNSHLIYINEKNIIDHIFKVN
jgi:hypothetical protein